MALGSGRIYREPPFGLAARAWSIQEPRAKSRIASAESKRIVMILDVMMYSHCFRGAQRLESNDHMEHIYNSTSYNTVQ